MQEQTENCYESIAQHKTVPPLVINIAIWYSLWGLQEQSSPSQVEDGMMILTLSDFSQLKRGLCWPWPQFCTEFSLIKLLHEYACMLSLKLSQFCCSGRHSFEKDPMCSPYLPQVISPSFLLPLFALIVSFGSAATKRQTRFLGNSTFIIQKNQQKPSQDWLWQWVLCVSFIGLGLSW